MQCINCGQGAAWVFSTTGVDDQPYCDRHLPRAYRGSASVSAAPEEVAVEPVEETEKPRRTRRRKADEEE